MTEHDSTAVLDWNQRVIEEFRDNAGRVGGAFEGAPMVVLTTTGVRSGQRRTSPLIYLADGDRILVFGSNAGRPSHPAWFHNLVADRRVTVEIGTGSAVEVFSATAVPLEGEERDRLYGMQAELVPRFAEYQAGTSRVIPVVALYRSDAEAERSRALALGDELVKVHDLLRRDLAGIRTELGESAPGEPSLDLQLRMQCLSFCTAVGAHHANEDDIGFPYLDEHHPELGEALDRLRREHGVVAELLARLRELLSGEYADATRVRAEVDRLAADLEAHLTYEEAQLVPVLNSFTELPWARPGTPSD